MKPMEIMSPVRTVPHNITMARRTETFRMADGVTISFLLSEAGASRSLRVFVPYDEAVKLSAQLRRAIETGRQETDDQRECDTR